MNEDNLNILEVVGGHIPPIQPGLTVNVSLVSGSSCQYQFTITVIPADVDPSESHPITDGRVEFTLAAGFADPTNVSPAGSLTYNTDASTGLSFGSWDFQSLANRQPKTLTFRSVYTGASGVTIFADDLTLEYEAGSNEYSTTIAAPTTTTANTCPTPPVTTTCCESCNEGFDEAVINSACDDYVEKTVTPSIDSYGRRLAVNLNMPPVCEPKDVLVGVFVTELQEDGVTEVPFAHKITRLSSNSSGTGCADTRNCSCLNFLIDDDTTTACTSRTFRIRTLAHYADNDGVQTCQCDTCTP